ncbi:TonB-dependent receptor plug domain-containing protein [Teredinibacter turnerae]|uniref:TonB-dependent receptor plug domain-containing protein n=1 Tax=Teredinibacter turnerae TaxID=2426 RepID=UPI00048E5919|nr:TonB-dependent receptor [Teredinibacter turnerae]
MKSIYIAALGTMAACQPGTLVAQTLTDNNANSNNIEETIVLGFRQAGYTEITQSAEKLTNMPGSFGDPVGAITALPGVITPRDGGEPAVRGSAPEDNRYYIDGMPAGYIFHEFNTSIFDENVVQDFQLFAAGFGAQYSEATGAVFDIRLRDPVNDAFVTKVTASMLRAGVFVESGLSDSAAFYLSARHGLIHLFVSEDDEPDDDGVRVISAPKDTDYQFKTKWDMADSHSLSLSLAGASDFAEAEFGEYNNEAQKNPDFAGQATIDRNFHSQGINYTFVSDDNVESNLTLARYADSRLVEWGDDYYLELELENILARGHLSQQFGNHTVSLGGEYSNKTHDYNARLIRFICTDFDVDCEDRRGLVEEVVSVDIAETNIYITDFWQPTDRVSVELGVQRSGNDYTEDYYVNPKLALSWMFVEGLTVSTSGGRYNRTPDIETIVPAVGNPALESHRAEHYTLGLAGEVGDSWTWSVEGYFKMLTNLPLALDESQPDADIYYSNDVEGEVRGVDIMLNKNLTEKWFGWVAVSLAESERTNLRTEETREYTLDTPVVFNLVANYQLTEKWMLGGRFTYKSGQATTEIVGIKPNEDFEGRYLPVYGEAYAERLPYYSRLDFRAERRFSVAGNEASFFVDILNLLNRENVSEENLDYKKVNETGELYLKESVDMGIFPSIGVSITF